MDKQDAVAKQLPEIIGLARLAPSVHNTQPWRVAAEGNVIKVRLDSAHVLADGDPTGRETTISMGIFCEAIKIAAESLGFRVKDPVWTTQGEATVTVDGKVKPSATAKRYAKLLEVRHSDRSIYKPAGIGAAAVGRIEKSGQGDGVETRLSTNRALISKVAGLTGKGISLALSNPGFRQELSRYLVPPWSRRRRGIAVKSLYIPFWLAWAQPWLVRSGLGVGSEAKLERRRWESASAVVLILGDGDLAGYWFEVGRAYLRVSLEIADLGLAQATSAAIVEASNYHDDIEKMLGTRKRILALIRIGRGSRRHHHSPRLGADELITSN